MHDHPIHDISFIDGNQAPWIASKRAAHVNIKKLGRVNGRQLLLVRFEPGASFPRHRHDQPEFLYLLEGEAIQNGQKLQPGWASAAPAGSWDESFYSESGCLFLLCDAVCASH